MSDLSGLTEWCFAPGSVRKIDYVDFVAYEALPTPLADHLPAFPTRYFVDEIFERRGWPWPSLQMQLWEAQWNVPTNAIIEQDFERIIVPRRACLTIGLTEADLRRSDFWDPQVFQREFVMLPLSPVWGGLLGSTLFYAIVVHAAVRMWIVARQMLRKAPGRCRRCGYVLKGNVSGVCSECGTQIREHSADQAAR